MQAIANNGPVKKTKRSLGFWGLILALLSPLSCGLTMLLALPICVAGLFRKKGRGLAIWGLAVSSAFSVAGLLLFVTVIPMGTKPHPLNLYKFRRACQSDFWLNYDPGHMRNISSFNVVILARYGLMFFDAEPGTYSPEKVIAFAEDNGWFCRGKAEATKEQLKQYSSGKLDEEHGDAFWVPFFYQGYSSNTTWQQKDIVIFVFDTGNIHGIGSYISIGSDGSQMEVRYLDPHLPDPAGKFYLPEGFEAID